MYWNSQVQIYGERILKWHEAHEQNSVIRILEWGLILTISPFLLQILNKPKICFEGSSNPPEQICQELEGGCIRKEKMGNGHFTTSLELTISPNIAVFSEGQAKKSFSASTANDIQFYTVLARLQCFAVLLISTSKQTLHTLVLKSHRPFSLQTSICRKGKMKIESDVTQGNCHSVEDSLGLKHHVTMLCLSKLPTVLVINNQ